MMIALFFIKVFFNKSGEILNLICIFYATALSIARNGGYAHKSNRIKDFYHIVLNEIKVAA